MTDPERAVESEGQTGRPHDPSIHAEAGRDRAKDDGFNALAGDADHVAEAWRARRQSCEPEPQPGERVGLRVVVAASVALMAVAAVAYATTEAQPADVNIVGFLLVVWTVLLTATFGWLNARYPTRYRPAMWAFAPLVPMAAVAATAGLALFFADGQQVRPLAIAIGSYVAVSAWVLGSAAVREVSRADTASTRSFELIELRYRQLSERVDSINGRGSSPVGLEAPDAPTTAGVQGAAADHEALAKDDTRPTQGDNRLARFVAINEARAELAWVICNISYPPHTRSSNIRSGFRWATASGYVNCFRALHRAEEALIEIEPRVLLIGDGLHDYLSLRDSRVPNRDGLMAGIRRAVGRLDPSVAEDFFESAESGNGGRGPGTDAAARAEAGRLDDRASRAVLREVRFAVNDFRDDAFDGLVRQRNRLWRTILATGLVTYALLALGVLARAPTEQLQIASAFFLTGAIVGMFNQLRIAGSAKSAIEDFGLSEALLVQVPVVSGLAALAGVVLTGILSPAALATAGDVINAPTLKEIFGPETFAAYLLVAAVFGLSPALLVDRLRKETRELQNDIASSEPTRKEQRLSDTA
jgi:hypothetical protein